MLLNIYIKYYINLQEAENRKSIKKSITYFIKFTIYSQFKTLTVLDFLKRGYEINNILKIYARKNIEYFVHLSVENFRTL